MSDFAYILAKNASSYSQNRTTFAVK